MDSLLSTGTSLHQPSSMFPSNLSSSSGPSHTSTRDTSPDTHHHHQYHHSDYDSHRHQQPTPPDSTLTSPIEGQSYSLLRSFSPFSPNMERGPFDSASGRRNKLMLERVGSFQAPNSYAHTQNLAQNHTYGQSNDRSHTISTYPTTTHNTTHNKNTDNVPVHAIASSPQHVASRTITSSNWRTPGMTMDNAQQPFTPASSSFPFAVENGSSVGYANGGGGIPGGGVALAPAMGTTNDLSLAQPPQIQFGGCNGGGSGSMVDGVYAYCFDRGNGQFTRLIPADMLPPLQDIPPLQQGCHGMAILPVPRGLAPNGRSSNSERVGVQSHIDTIIATTPPPNSHRRPKIYCDKWVHEGVCAFTQQGCKYKHEMPFDKATQHSLGLFHGLPAWWKKHQAELSRQQDMVDVSDQPVAVGSRDRSLAGPNRLAATPWRRGVDASAPVTQFSSPFGPIGPPIRKGHPEHHDPNSSSQASRGVMNINPFATFGQQGGNGDGENIRNGQVAL